MRRPLAPVVYVALASLLLCGSGITASPRHMSRLTAWLAAVASHKAGARDAAVETVGRWKNDELDDITPLIGVLVDLLPDPEKETVDLPRGWKAADLDAMRDLARREAARGDVNRIMKRGALLHADAMITGVAGDVQRISAAEARREVARVGRVSVLGVDGQHTGYAAVTRHWSIARRLLDAVHPDPSSDDFVRAWYRATTAFMLRGSKWGEADRQLAHARQRLTPDAHVHLSTGCVYDAYAGPRVQAVIASGISHGVRADIRAVQTNRELAERHFGQALVLDPTLAEARVRLARVRTLLGRPVDAVPDLERARVESSDPHVRYYAALFLGDAERARGNPDAARAAYESAAALYPTAQAPHLAISLLARERSDREGAQFALRNLAHTSIRAPLDPWWVYQMCSGRSLPALLVQLWKALPASTQQ